MEWAGPLYAAASGNPPEIEGRGVAGICSVDVYGPEQVTTSMAPTTHVLWSINHTLRFPFQTKFRYGEVPAGFEQITPGGNTSPPALSPDSTYKLVLGRCMGGPQYLSLHKDLISSYISK